MFLFCQGFSLDGGGKPDTGSSYIMCQAREFVKLLEILLAKGAHCLLKGGQMLNRGVMKIVELTPLVSLSFSLSIFSLDCVSCTPSSRGSSSIPAPSCIGVSVPFLN